MLARLWRNWNPVLCGQECERVQLLWKTASRLSLPPNKEPILSVWSSNSTPRLLLQKVWRQRLAKVFVFDEFLQSGIIRTKVKGRAATKRAAQVPIAGCEDEKSRRDNYSTLRRRILWPMPQDYDQWKEIVTRLICQRLPRGGNEGYSLLDGYRVLIWKRGRVAVGWIIMWMFLMTLSWT